LWRGFQPLWIIIWHGPILAFVVVLPLIILAAGGQGGAWIVFGAMGGALGYCGMLALIDFALHGFNRRFGDRRDSTTFLKTFRHATPTHLETPHIPDDSLLAMRSALARTYGVSADLIRADDSVWTLARFSILSIPSLHEFIYELDRELNGLLKSAKRPEDFASELPPRETREAFCEWMPDVLRMVERQTTRRAGAAGATEQMPRSDRDLLMELAPDWVRQLERERTRDQQLDGLVKRIGSDRAFPCRTVQELFYVAWRGINAPR
jgi:hypothetical protein